MSFIVTHENVVIYSREVTKHNLLMLKSGHFPEQIAWGGILDETGDWVRPSIDFGDAPSTSVRAETLGLLNSME